jgi:hypothetical protein
MNKMNIYYTGIGAKKSGKYTEKEYLEVMDKNFKKDCSVHMKSLKCKSCKKTIKMVTKEMKKQIKFNLNKKNKMSNKTYKISNKTEQRIVNQRKKCKKCENKGTKKCDLKNYILFSGAEIQNV